MSTTSPESPPAIDALASADDTATTAIDLSVLIPIFNEEENIAPLAEELDTVLSGLNLRYEIIFVDDGSIDGSAERLADARRRDPDHVRVARLRRNCGQTAALSAALDMARGRILIPMDGDLQNDPADIPRLLAKLEEGFDVVSGWRRDRKDPFLTRKLPSIMANGLVARISGVPLHDFGCTLKAYRRRVLQGVRLYGEMHRFIPVFARWQGAKVAELVVNHRARTAGKSKYGLSRTFNVVLDLILIRFFDRYAQRPIHLFGRLGLFSIFLSSLIFVLMLYLKYIYPFPLPADVDQAKDFVETPLPVLSAMFLLFGGQNILTGVLAEMVMRTYYESQDKRTYLIDEDDAS